MKQLLQALPNDALEQIRRAKARKRMIDFTTYTMPDYEVNWHHNALCSYLDRFMHGDINRLMIFMPPRNGKSELVSRRLPAYIFGVEPDASIIACAYGSDLAQRMNRDVQRIIDDEKYEELFPKSKLFGANIRTVTKGSWLRNSDIFEIVGSKGVYKCAGVGGAITGMGCKYGIIDDPYKNRQDANSETVRNAIWDWYTSTFYTRLEKGAKILITLTRWHEDDLAGKLLEMEKSDPNADKWTVVKFPAIYEGVDEYTPEDDKRALGEALWENKYSVDVLKKIKSTVGAYDWNALFQQSPSPLSGGMFKRYFWRYWKPKGMDLPPVTVKNDDGEYINIDAIDAPDTYDEVIQSWDCTFKDNKDSDFVAGQVWGKVKADRFLLDRINDRLDFVATIQAIKAMSTKHPYARLKLIEDKANGTAIINMLKNELSGLVAVEPQGGKIARATAVSPQIESGNVYLPHPHICPWVNEYIEQFATFPNGKHDDEVDSTSQALNRLMDGVDAIIFA